MNTETLSNIEKSLILFLETCATERGGLVNSERLNKEDYQLIDMWVQKGFIDFGCVSFDSLPLSINASHWCELSDEAWETAHSERRMRNQRIAEKRRWKKTSELSAA